MNVRATASGVVSERCAPAPSARHEISSLEPGFARILAVMPSIPLQGMEKANIKIMRLLRQAGADVLFIGESRWGHAVTDAIRASGCRETSIELDEGLRLPRTPREAAWLMQHWRRVNREILSITREFQPTHLYLTNLTYFLFTLPPTSAARPKVVFRLPNPPETGLSSLRQRFHDWLWRSVIVPRTDEFVCNSDYTCRLLRGLVPHDTRVTVIRNCVPEPSRMERSDAPRLDPEAFNVVYVGRIRPEKGVAELYRAARNLVARHSDIEFHLAGEHHWRNPFAASLIEHNERSGLSARIRFLGHVTDVESLLRQSHLHVCPSTSPNESFPNVILEAKQASLPSVVFPVAGLPEAVTHEVDGLVCRYSTAAALEESIERYVQDRSLRERHARAARRSLASFDDAAIGEQWVRLFAGGSRARGCPSSA